MIVLQPPLLCEKWDGHPLCVSGDRPVLMDLHWSRECIAQSGILSIGLVSAEVQACSKAAALYSAEV